MEKAAFSLKNYIFDKVILNFENKVSSEIEVSFEPKAIFGDNKVTVIILFRAFSPGKKEDPYVEIRCIATFEFQSHIDIESVPNYFYNNSIAIIFPYIRSFVSTVTLQANIIPPILIPTWNMESLGKDLKENIENNKPVE